MAFKATIKFECVVESSGLLVVVVVVVVVCVVCVATAVD